MGLQLATPAAGRLVAHAVDRGYPVRHLSIVLAATLAATVPATDAARSDEAERLANEITNLRALPYGFAAWCESGTLRMNREGSGGFHVTDSAICRFMPEGHFVCTTDPNREEQPNHPPIPHCHELEAPDPGGAI